MGATLKILPTYQEMSQSLTEYQSKIYGDMVAAKRRRATNAHISSVISHQSVTSENITQYYRAFNRLNYHYDNLVLLETNLLAKSYYDRLDQANIIKRLRRIKQAIQKHLDTLRCSISALTEQSVAPTFKRICLELLNNITTSLEGKYKEATLQFFYLYDKTLQQDRWYCYIGLSNLITETGFTFPTFYIVCTLSSDDLIDINVYPTFIAPTNLLLSGGFSTYSETYDYLRKLMQREKIVLPSVKTLSIDTGH
jgi:hypothetical protein